MTRKHFEAIAHELRLTKPSFVLNDKEQKYGAEYRQWRKDVDAIASVCRQLNSRFDRDRFLLACGV